VDDPPLSGTVKGTILKDPAITGVLWAMAEPQRENIARSPASRSAAAMLPKWDGTTGNTCSASVLNWANSVCFWRIQFFQAAVNMPFTVKIIGNMPHRNALIESEVL
jgi:hypothetical protein